MDDDMVRPLNVRALQQNRSKLTCAVAMSVLYTIVTGVNTVAVDQVTQTCVSFVSRSTGVRKRTSQANRAILS